MLNLYLLYTQHTGSPYKFKHLFIIGTYYLHIILINDYDYVFFMLHLYIRYFSIIIYE